MSLPYIIAEAGSCHQGSLSNATTLIRKAKEAGADAIKFQYWETPARMRERRGIADSSMYEAGSIKRIWFPHLRKITQDLGITFLCSVYCPEDVAEVTQWVDGFKVSSFESRDPALRDAIVEMAGDRPIFVSTGMQEEGERLEWPRPVIHLHCVSAYPCPLKEANLGAIEPHEGYSDHTACVWTGGFAVAAGADYLEVHFRLEETAESCPDYPVALTPVQLQQYIYLAHAGYVMRGPGEKTVMPSERDNLKYRVQP